MLHNFISSKTRVNLLRLFLQNPGRKYYLREISKLLGEAVTPIRRELLNLIEVGLLTKTHVANIIYYSVDPGFLLYDELVNMIKKTDAIESKEALAEVRMNTA